MANYQLDLNTAALHQIGMDTAHTLVTRVTRRTLNRSAVLVPVDKGRLRASGMMRVGRFGSEVRGEVEYDADYALAVHNGTPAHIITPRAGRVLRFDTPGGVVYARRVHHPGTPGRPFLTDALQDVAEAEGFDVTISIG